MAGQKIMSEVVTNAVSHWAALRWPEVTFIT